MGELDRVAQRHLQHRYPELDPLSGDAERAECYERIERGPAATDRVGHPNPRKAAPFDLPGVVDDAPERPAAGLGAGAHEGHHAQSHDRLPSDSIAVTLSSSRSWWIARQCNTSAVAANSRLLRPPVRQARPAPAGCRPTGDFPRPREDTGKTRFRAALGAGQMPVSH